MIDAGVDVVLPVYWGAPEHGRVPPSTGASPACRPWPRPRKRCIKKGKKPPAIGLFTTPRR